MTGSDVTVMVLSEPVVCHEFLLHPDRIITGRGIGVPTVAAAATRSRRSGAAMICLQTPGPLYTS